MLATCLGFFQWDRECSFAASPRFLRLLNNEHVLRNVRQQERRVKWVARHGGNVSS
jgi:hypothetical protein